MCIKYDFNGKFVFYFKTKMALPNRVLCIFFLLITLQNAAITTFLNKNYRFMLSIFFFILITL